MATSFLSLYFIETISPVDTHQSDHRQEDTNAHSGRTFQRERIEVFERCPRITALDKSQTIYRRRRLQQEREVQLHREPGISPTIGIGRKRTVIITPQPNCLRSIWSYRRHPHRMFRKASAYTCYTTPTIRNRHVP